MPELFIITPEWSEQSWLNTGGTRAKKIIVSPEGKVYYFKQSQYKPATETKLGKDFTYEFWNEIIAYELGTMLGFNMLRYDIAIDGDIMGCISESMIDNSQELIEGVKYLQSYLPDYDPAKKEHQPLYTFDNIFQALGSVQHALFMNEIIKIIVFDALIGNGDRHQENWAIITEQKSLLYLQKELDINFDRITYSERYILSLMKETYKKDGMTDEDLDEELKSIYTPVYSSAPIYDSGSSLGRELIEERIKKYLLNELDLNKYVDNGKSEIHWEGKKIPHFELIKNIKDSKHSGYLQLLIQHVKDSFDADKLKFFIDTIDEKVPETHIQYKIPPNRKELIFKIITLRFKKLCATTNERI